MAKSVAKNALYSGIRTISTMLFPLVTYPYVTRVLLAQNLGKVDFSVSIISYFTLIAGLGITNYATREGARVREDRKALDQFSSEVFTINMGSTLLAYILLILLYAVWPHLQGYGLLMAIQSATLIGTTIGVEWLYTLSEDFGYITARSVAVQLVSAVLLFTLVHEPSDYLIYAAITVFSGVGANVFNFIRSRRYATIRLVWGFDVKRHLIPMLVLFGNAIAVSIYINIDVTLLDVIRGDYEVGIYSVSVKIYKLAKQLLNAIITVSIPRLSLYLANKDDEGYQNLLGSIVHALIITTLPAILLLFLLANYVVLIVGGEAFLESIPSLQLLCAALAPSVLATYVANSILLPNRCERLILRATIVGAVSNLTLNLIAIPLWGANGAAITTALAELFVLIVAGKYARDYCDLGRLVREQRHTCVTTLMGLVGIVAAYVLATRLLGESLVTFFVAGGAGCLLYALILVIRHDSLATALIGKLAKRKA